MIAKDFFLNKDNLLKFILFCIVLIIIFPSNVICFFENSPFNLLNYSCKFTVPDYVYANIKKADKFLVFPLSYIFFHLFLIIIYFIKIKLFIKKKIYFFICFFSIGIFLLFYNGFLNKNTFKILYHFSFLFHICFITNFFKEYIIKNKKIFRNIFFYYIILFNLILFFSNMNFLFLSHIQNELIIPSQLYGMFVISHYRDYFIFLSFISFGFLYLLRKEINYTYKFFSIINYITWFYINSKSEFNGTFYLSFLSLILMLIIFKNFTLFKNLILKKNIVIYAPFSIYLYFAISGIYGIHYSLDERFRQIYRNFSNVDFIFFPIFNSNSLSYFNHAHNDFLDIFYCFGLFSFLIYKKITIFIIKLFKSSYIIGCIFISTFFVGGLTQNNLVNPYLSINFLIIGMLFLFIYSKSKL